MNFNRVFHYKPSILGVPLFLETPICRNQPGARYLTLRFLGRTLESDRVRPTKAVMGGGYRTDFTQMVVNCKGNWVVGSIIFYFHPYLGKIPILTNIFQRGWNHQLGNHRKFQGNLGWWNIFLIWPDIGQIQCFSWMWELSLMCHGWDFWIKNTWVKSQDTVVVWVIRGSEKLPLVISEWWNCPWNGNPEPELTCIAWTPVSCILQGPILLADQLVGRWGYIIPLKHRQDLNKL